MTWCALHNYGEGQFQLVDEGVRRPPSPDEARAIAAELEQFAAATDEATAIARADAGIAPADPDVDFALFRDKNHPVVAVVKVPGGARLRCLACHVEGKRLYQDEEGAQAYARMLSGVRIPAWPKCVILMGGA